MSPTFIRVKITHKVSLIAVRRIDSLRQGGGDEGGCIVFLDGDLAGVRLKDAYRDIEDALLGVG